MGHEDYMNIIYAMIEGRDDLGTSRDKLFHFNWEIEKYNQNHNPIIQPSEVQDFLRNHKFTDGN